MIGHHVRNLDEKNRVMIPTKFRDELGSVFYISISPDKVLELRDAKTFKVFEDKLLAMNSLNANARKMSRLILGRSQEVIIDKQGRMAVQSELAQMAGLTKEVVFVGVGNKVELWDKAKWDALQNEFEGEESLDDLAAALFKDGVEL